MKNAMPPPRDLWQRNSTLLDFGGMFPMPTAQPSAKIEEDGLAVFLGIDRKVDRGEDGAVRVPVL